VSANANHWAVQQERSNPSALWLIVFIARNIGRWAGRLLLYPIVGYFLLTSRHVRRHSRRYLARVLQRPVGLRDVARHIHVFASTLLDRVFLLTSRFDVLDVHVHHAEQVLKHVHAGRGVVLLGSHLGSFEVMRAMATTRPELEVKILMHRGQNAMFMRAAERLNPALAQAIIDTGQRDTDLILEVKEALERGCCVGMLGDRSYGGERLVRCRFLGGEVALPAAPLLLASLLKVPVVLCFGLYGGGNRYDVHFEELGADIRIERRSREADLQHWVQRYADRLEHYTRMAPYNWFNFFDYWHEDERPDAPARG
jgi:predicted LPLAT superfamily acyltransferase